MENKFFVDLICLFSTLKNDSLLIQSGSSQPKSGLSANRVTPGHHAGDINQHSLHGCTTIRGDFHFKLPPLS